MQPALLGAAVDLRVRSRDATDTSTPVAVACFLAAAGFLLAGLLRIGDVSPMPALPWQVVAPAGLLAGLLALVRTSRWVVIAQFTAGVLLLLGSLGRLPHNLLFALVWGITQISGAEPAFPMDPNWPKFVVHLLALASVALLGWHVRARLRAHPELIPASLRAARMPRARAMRWSRAFGAVGVLAALPYGGLKLAWSLGWRGGMDDGFEDVGAETPGFGDTVALTGVAIVLAVLMAVPVRQRLARAALLAIGLIGTLMLIPVGVIGSYELLITAFGAQPNENTTLALWVFALVYPAMLLWGVALAGQTWCYRSATAPDPETRTRT